MQAEFAIKAEPVEGVPPKRFTDGGKHYYYVRIFIEASEQALNQVELIKYKLHPTFKERFRVSESRSRNFEIRIWTYGYFDIQATLVMRDGRTAEIRGYVEWRVPPGMPFDDKEE